MSFQKGMAKPAGSGRKKGQKNRSSMLCVREVLLENKVNPIAEILKLLPTLDPRDQVKTWLELHQYVESKSTYEAADEDETVETNPAAVLSEAALLAIVKSVQP